MADSNTSLTELFKNVPADLAEYFSQNVHESFRGREELQLNLLPIPQVVQLTREFRSFHPIVNLLGGVVLDDANTSNHHVYLSSGPCAGAVLYLDHDGDSKIVFSTVREFIDSALKAVNTERDLPSFHPEHSVLLADQFGLNRLVANLYDQQQDTTVIATLIHSMNLKDIDLLSRLAVDQDFYIAEAIGDAIASRPRADLEALATICGNHPHFQASRAGIRAIAAILALN